MQATTSVLGEKKIIEATPVTDLLKDLHSLPESARLLSHHHYSLFLASAEKIPAILREICRQREIAFREVGEGTGKEMDRDHYDAYYLHLFLWDEKALAVVGAYRLGLVDEILRDYGREGLYCTSLFVFQQKLLDYLNPGLELGRSFIAKAYQKNYQSLALLWKGIGKFVSRNPQYAILFGPVSISQNYTKISQNLIVKFMNTERKDPFFASLVTPLYPYKADEKEEGVVKAPLKSIEEVSASIAEVESDGKGIPILLKHYLKLNATLLSFNVDPAFGYCLDALILVDLRKSPSLLLKKYMGKEGYKNFTERHLQQEAET